MKKDNMMTMVLVLGGLGVAYWYVTRYGPSGAAYDATGRQVQPTWWDTWFGGGTQAAQVPAGTQSNTTTPTSTTQTPGGSGQPAPSTTTDVRTKLLTASGGVNNLNADQWNYYRNNLFPPALSAQQFGLAFPVRSDPMPAMTVDQFMQALVSAGINPANPGTGVSGIRGVVSAQPVPPIPSMSFGGSLATARPRLVSGTTPSVFRNRMNQGGYIQ